MVAHIDTHVAEPREDRGLWRSTLVIISAKHGQSPLDPSKLAMEAGGSGDATVQAPRDFLDFASSGGRLQTDEVGLVWLQEQSKDNLHQVVKQLTDNAAAIRARALPPRTIFGSNIASDDALAHIYGDPTSGDRVANARAPEGFIHEGVIYSGSSKKIAEHGRRRQLGRGEVARLHHPGGADDPWASSQKP